MGGKLFNFVRSVFGASVNSLQSSEGAESRKALAVAAEAATNVARGFSSAWQRVKAVWNNELGDQSKIESTDEYLQRAGSAIRSIATSEEVKQSLSAATENSLKSTKEIGTATSLLVKKISSELSESDAWNKAVSDFGSSFSMLLAAFAAGAAKAVQSRQDRQLPPPNR